MIQVQQMKFRYGQQGFSLLVREMEVSRGEKLAIVGPSGSGKTTFLDLVAGIQLPESGTIRVGDMDLSQLGEKSRRDFRSSKMGLVFQEFELLEYLSVADNIRLPFLINRSISRRSLDSDTLTQLAEQVGIGDKLHRRPHQLSQGERQRVAICRALVHQPELLLADEPTGNLDPANKNRIMDLLLDQAEKLSSTLIVVTHDQALLGRFDRTIDVSEFEV
ncbi:MAG: ABC transporter ATP-binding protein [Planctomycetota bacterium]|nr:ABC transporter ATP-binding protein [Planctomycetota bacterium]